MLRFRRRWWAWALLIVLVWLPLSWATRWLMNAPPLALGFWQLAALSTLQMVLRPDLLIACFMVYRAACGTEWQSLRNDIMVTFVTPLQIVTGKAAVPVLVLFTLNLIAFIPAYSPLLDDPDLLVSLRLGSESESASQSAPSYEALFADEDDALTSPVVRQVTPVQRPQQSGFVVSVALPVMFFGLLEDLLYAALVVMIAMRGFLYHRDVLRAALGIVARLLVVGLLIALAQWAWPGIVLIGGRELELWTFRNPGLSFLAGNALWFAVILPAEALLIRHYFYAVRTDMEEWLESRE